MPCHLSPQATTKMTLARTDTFVPLTAAKPARPGELTDFRATVVSQPGSVQKFKAVESSSALPGAAPRPANCEARVNVQRDGERVTGIRIQCSCGQVIDLACEYEALIAPKPEVPKAESPKSEGPKPELAAPEATKSAKPETAPGKICKEQGKDLPKTEAKGQKKPEKGRGTSAAKRR